MSGPVHSEAPCDRHPSPVAVDMWRAAPDAVICRGNHDTIFLVEQSLMVSLMVCVTNGGLEMVLIVKYIGSCGGFLDCRNATDPKQHVRGDERLSTVIGVFCD